MEGDLTKHSRAHLCKATKPDPCTICVFLWVCLPLEPLECRENGRRARKINAECNDYRKGNLDHVSKNLNRGSWVPATHTQWWSIMLHPDYAHSRK